MTDDLVKRLRRDLASGLSASIGDTQDAADRIELLERELAEAIRYIKELENELDNIEYEMCELENRND